MQKYVGPANAIERVAAEAAVVEAPPGGPAAAPLPSGIGPLRVLAYTIVVGAGLLLGAFLGLIAALMFGLIDIC
ncbi:MAG: hypothetical protein AB7O57_09985 [Hyphomicrobiaceae bacterium]